MIAPRIAGNIAVDLLEFAFPGGNDSAHSVAVPADPDTLLTLLLLAQSP